MCKVAQVLEGIPVGEIDGVCVCDILLFKYARLTSCDMERSFSQYKSLFRDNRHAFVMENLEMTFVVHCNSRPTTSTQVWWNLPTPRSCLRQEGGDCEDDVTQRDKLCEVEETRHQHRFSIDVWAGVLDDRLIGPYLPPQRLIGARYQDFLINVLPALRSLERANLLSNLEKRQNIQENKRRQRDGILLASYAISRL
ncbi:hypothetical protein ANN_27309 [Periplaneta americana]|uniref:Uncharacterized protein n=1 Tax=Periplaneta americana TaxID=6978 RepID=A0ABQ8RY84_PERAM|nr:hypothetical protein ANN_27309 [Periplaneta americana]